LGYLHIHSLILSREPFLSMGFTEKWTFRVNLISKGRLLPFKEL